MTASFIPKQGCTNASGGCFTAGACLYQCSAGRKKDHESRIRALERRLLQLEILAYRAIAPTQPADSNSPEFGGISATPTTQQE